MFWVVSQSRRWRHPSEEFAKLLARTLLLQLDMLASSVFLETSIPSIPSITVLSFHLVYSARAPLRTTLYAGSTLTRVPRYRPIWPAELGKRGLIYRTGSLAKGTKEAHRSPRCSATSVYSLSNPQRTRNASCPAPTGSREAVARLPTGSSEAVARLRLPQNVACGFTALRSSIGGSQHSLLFAQVSFPWSADLLFELNAGSPVAWSPCFPRTIHLPLTASPCGRLSRPRSTISQYDFHSVVRPPSPCRLVGP